MKLNIGQHPWYIKLSSWEYWPWWILYIPVYIQHIVLSIKAKSPFFIYKANPVIDEGFILGDSKVCLLKLVLIKVNSVILSFPHYIVPVFKESCSAFSCPGY